MTFKADKLSLLGTRTAFKPYCVEPPQAAFPNSSLEAGILYTILLWQINDWGNLEKKGGNPEGAERGRREHTNV